MENKEIIFKVSIEEANLILNSLSEQPFKSVASLINRITTEAQEQLKANQE